MTEIPRDQKNYLAWHRAIGIMAVWWCVATKKYHEAVGTCIGDEVDEKYLERWMDEKGQWHEIKNSCTPNICKRCRKEVIDSIDAQIKLLSKSGEG